MPVKMIAKKPLTYGTRRLKAGREFDANPRDARALKAIGKADYATRAMTAAKPAPKPEPEIVEPDITALRAEYERVVGRKPYMGWKADVLVTKIAEAKAVTAGTDDILPSC